MGRPVIDLTGQRYGMLSILCRDPDWIGGKGKSARWIVKCDCGKVRLMGSNIIRTLGQVSCGCMRGVGGRKEKIFNAPKEIQQRWMNMMRRCYKPFNGKDRKNYMERGITVCKRWHDRDSFYEDVGDIPFKNATIDRVDNNGNYEPSNVRWATYSQQNKNRRPFKMTRRARYCHVE